jgi:hypothetical protein
VVLAEYDGAYVDGTFGSAFDVGMEKVDVSKMASLVSRNGARVGEPGVFVFPCRPTAKAKTNETHDDDDAKTSSLSALKELVSANLPDFDAVEETTRSLAECLIDPKVGFECALAKKMAFEPQETFPSRYAGVAPITIGKRDFDAETDGVVGAGADDVARFVFEFLAEATSEIRGESARFVVRVAGRVRGRRGVRPCLRGRPRGRPRGRRRRRRRERSSTRAPPRVTRVGRVRRRRRRRGDVR